MNSSIQLHYKLYIVVDSHQLANVHTYGNNIKLGHWLG